MPDRRGPAGGNLALHILFTNESFDSGINQGLIGGHKSQTDRMTSVILLSDVNVSGLYPNLHVKDASESRKQNRLYIQP